MNNPFMILWSFNSLPNDKILDWSKLKAFADDKINETFFNFFQGTEETMMKKEKMLVTVPAFSPFPTMFSKVFFLKVAKSQDCVVKS